MILYDDTQIDDILWDEIACSKVADDFAAYVSHSPEGAKHIEEARRKFFEFSDGESHEPRLFKKAISKIQELAESGNPTAMFHMGKFYSNGTGVEQDDDLAEVWYLRGIESGELRSYCNLGNMYLLSDRGKKDVSKGVELLKHASEVGETVATSTLGEAGIEGLYKGISNQEAIRLLEKAALDGLASAAYKLSRLYYEGNSVDKDIAEAGKWLETAVDLEADYLPYLGRFWLVDVEPPNPEKGIQLIEQAYNEGVQFAAQWLGQLYEDGKIVEKDLNKSRFWYDKAIADHNSASMIAVALQILNSAGESRDPLEAKSLLEEAWRLRNCRASAYLGQMYRMGDGVPESDEVALEWCRKGAEKGDPKASFHLAWMYENGKGTEENSREAEKWYLKATEGGYPEAAEFLGKFYLSAEGHYRNGAEGVKWLMTAVDQGRNSAMLALGAAYLYGLGVIKNQEEGFRWYQKAAEAGLTEGESKLAELLMRGEGVEANHAEAANWCKKAAEHGHAFAQGLLAFMYTTGNGVETNEDEAFKWSQLSALQNNPSGQWVLAECYLWGRGTQKDTAKAIEWLVKSAKAGVERSQRRLAEIYYYGMEEVKQDFAEAGRWASLAADQGDPQAQSIVGEMFVFGYGVETDNSAGASWLGRAAEQGHHRAQGLLGVMYAEGVGVKRDWLTALRWLKKAADGEDERALDYLKEHGVEYKPGQGTSSKLKIDPEQPVTRNPSFDVTLIPGKWMGKTEDSEWNTTITFEADGTFLGTSSTEDLEAWNYSGRWAVEGDRLMWDVLESDMPIPLDEDSDDTVISISHQVWFTKGNDGKRTTYNRVISEESPQPNGAGEKIIPLVKKVASSNDQG